MIKIALKHFIYEKCINVLFDGIINNFSTQKVIKFTADMFHKGDAYNYIKVYHDDKLRIFYECSIDILCPRSIAITYERYVECDKEGNRNDSYKYAPVVRAFLLYDEIIETSDPIKND